MLLYCFSCLDSVMKKNAMVDFKVERQKDMELMNNPANVRAMFKEMTLDESREYCVRDRFPVDACFLNITSDLNVSAGIRSLHLMGIDRIFVLGKRKLDRRALVGAEFYSDIVRLDGLNVDDLTISEDVFLEMVNSNADYFPVFVEQGGENMLGVDWSSRFKKPEGGAYRPLLIFGNEARGIGDNILSLRDSLPRSLTVTLPMRGVLRSLNVSASVAMVAWDVVSKMYASELEFGHL